MIDAGERIRGAIADVDGAALSDDSLARLRALDLNAGDIMELGIEGLGEQRQVVAQA